MNSNQKRILIKNSPLVILSVAIFSASITVIGDPDVHVGLQILTMAITTSSLGALLYWLYTTLKKHD